MATTRRKRGAKQKSSAADVDVVREQGVRATVRPMSAGQQRLRAAAAMTDARGSGEGTVTADLLRALHEQEIEQSHELDLKPTAAKSRGEPMAVFDVRVAPQQSAVILLEQEGVWSWHFPEPAAKTRSARRSARAASSGLSTLRISVKLRGGATPQRRGVSARSLVTAASGLVLKFVVRAGTNLALKLLERRVRPGLVVMKGPDVNAWATVEHIDDLGLRANKPRILVFLHGTFSSTIGSFGPLTATPEGRAFLSKAHEHYDAVIGLDHRTLSDTPLENAADLLQRLGRFDRPLELDFVTYSRGGLVYRALVEQLLAADAPRPKIGPVVFVAVPNNGTLFATPENWHALVDNYTNLATGALQLIGALPQATGVALMFDGLIAGIGTLVKVLADVVIAEKTVPGLAAQQTDGDFIRALNAFDATQPQPGNTRYLAITSNFDAKGALTGNKKAGLPKAFLLRLADGLVDGLMREPNDLVVNTSSMKQIDPEAGDYIDAALDFTDSDMVYHTVYFAQAKVAQQLHAWLLDEAARRGLFERTGLLVVRPSPRAPFTRVRYHVSGGPRHGKDAQPRTAAAAKPRRRTGVAAPKLDELRSAARRHALELLGEPNRPPTAAALRRERAANDAQPAKARSYAPTLTEDEVQVSRLPSERDLHVVSFTQTHAAIPIFGTRAVIELDADEQLIAARAKLARVDGVSPTPKLSAQQARAALAKAVPAAKRFKARRRTDAPSLTFFHDREHKRWRLTYLFSAVPGLPSSWEAQAKRGAHRQRKGCSSARSRHTHLPRLDCLIDANSGELVYAYSVSPSAAKIKALPVSCTGVDTDGELRSFDGAQRGKMIVLHDPQRGIRTFDLAGGDIDVADVPKQPIGNDTQEFGDATPAGISAHFYTSRVFDFYNQVLIRKGVDDKGAELVNVVNVTSRAEEPPPVWNNAVWWDKRMWYGRRRKGNGFESYGKHLDIIGHELTHGVTENTSDLVYLRESGALNESFSDIFGVLIKNWVQKGPDSDPEDWDWDIGTGLGRTKQLPLRNLENPRLTRDPDNMSDYLNVPDRVDYGGVHTNSNIHNKAAYNLITARVPGKTRSKRKPLVFSPVDVARLYYFTLQRIDRMARFEDVLSTLLDVVKTLYRDPSDQATKLAAVKAAYKAVGIPRSSEAMR
jgi:bacillolysin